MKQETIQIITWGAIIALVGALIARASYTRIVRGRWPIVEATLKSISGNSKLTSSAEGAVAFQPEYTYDLLYTYKGAQFSRCLSYPKIMKEKILLRVNPSDPREAYFNDDLTQQVTQIRSETKEC